MTLNFCFHFSSLIHVVLLKRKRILDKKNNNNNCDCEWFFSNTHSIQQRTRNFYLKRYCFFLLRQIFFHFISFSLFFATSETMTQLEWYLFSYENVSDCWLLKTKKLNPRVVVRKRNLCVFFSSRQNDLRLRLEKKRDFVVWKHQKHRNKINLMSSADIWYQIIKFQRIYNGEKLKKCASWRKTTFIPFRVSTKNKFWSDNGFC